MSDAKEGRAEKVMVIFAHPDDAEGNSGGTAAKWAREGKIIYYFVLTNGDKGTEDPSMTSAKLVPREPGFKSKEVQERVTNRASEVGRARGYLFGEAFKKIVM